jgi:cell fate regulator YaaT (PSP1 superfamily)
MTDKIAKDKQTSEDIIKQLKQDAAESERAAADELKTQEQSEGKIKIIEAQLGIATDLFPFEVNDLDLKIGTNIIVNLDGSTALAFVVGKPKIVNKVDVFPDGKVHKIIRLAEARDFEEAKKAVSKEKTAHEFCHKKIEELKLDMKLVCVKYLFGCKKAIFFFTANGRVDFRNLVKDLVAKFKIRIELRQIGVRDETKLVGGIASCGRELCCCNHSRKFPTVSIKMGKDQNLSLNPAKISGMCGRLLCCLSYEHDVYKELGKGIPKVGKRCQHEEKTGKVLNINILGRKALMLLDEGGVVTVGVDKLEQINAQQNRGKKQNQKQQPPVKVETPKEKMQAQLREEFRNMDLIPFHEM